MPKGKGWTALTPDEQQWAGPSWRPEEKVRQIVELPLVTQLANVRGHLWKFPPGGQGRKHLPPRSVVVLSPNTPIQIRNESAADAIAFMLGSPPVQGDGVILGG